MAPSISPSGVVNAPDGAREPLCFEPGSNRVRLISTNFDLLKLNIQESYLDMVFDMFRNQLEAFEPSSKRSNAME